MTEKAKNAGHTQGLDQIRLRMRQPWGLGLQKGPIFVNILRSLIECDALEDCELAVDPMHEFLANIEADTIKEFNLASSESAKLFSIILTIMVEAGQYRHELANFEKGTSSCDHEEPLPRMAELREHAIAVAKTYFSSSSWSSLRVDIEAEIFPLLESMGDASGKNSELARGRYMPFRVIQAGNIADRLYAFRLRTSDSRLLGGLESPGLLQCIFDRKYLRFGTSGVRGRWDLDFTETSAKRVAQAICAFLRGSEAPSYTGAEDLRGRKVIIGYDSRRNAQIVAEWMAQVCLANGFKVNLANRDTPTPALVYYLTDFLPSGEVAGLINCTASHNPPEWQGIKFNPRQGFPAPTNVTDFIASRANQLNILDESAAVANLSAAKTCGDLQGFDPIVHYSNWIMNSGKGNQRIAIDPVRIREHFSGKIVVVDEMHGASRGYLSRILGEIGVRHRIVHAERDPEIPGLDYANPEEPFIDSLKSEVRNTDGVALGVGMDTDADRFGVVDQNGIYFRPNQVLPMLVKYLGVDRGLTGRVIATQTGSPLLEFVAARISGNEANQPEAEVVPPYIDHPFYLRRIGRREDRVYRSTFMVAVGIKYIEEQRRTDRGYRTLKPLPSNWRDTILIGGEESSGLTTRGHVTDKDGIWANLLIMDMIAFYGKPLGEIWQDTVTFAGQTYYGGRESGQPFSNSGRTDVDAVLEAKEALINDYLDRYSNLDGNQAYLAGLRVVYAGGTRYDFVELQLEDANGCNQHYLRVRASGTEPINRIYVESADKQIACQLMSIALADLERLSSDEIRAARSEWRLVEILSSTQYSPDLADAATDAIDSHKDWTRGDVINKLKQLSSTLERRNQRVANLWVAALGKRAQGH